MPTAAIAISIILVMLQLVSHPSTQAAAGVQESPGTVSSATQRIWLGPDGLPLPPMSDAQVLEFLKTARVVSMKRVGKGVTNPHKVLLEKGSIRMHAVFRDVRRQKQKSRIRGAVRWNFRDDFIFECAAYELSVLLGLDSIPPAVLRKIKGKKGSLQIWIENAFSEGDRKRQGLTAPNSIHWARQRQVRQVFDQLINNEDRNLGNLLIDPDWKLWMIDHTRAFHPLFQLWKPKAIVTCERSLWERLRNLDRDRVRRQLKPFLRSNQLRALFQRWDRLLARIAKLIEERGAEYVLFDMG